MLLFILLDISDWTFIQFLQAGAYIVAIVGGISAITGRLFKRFAPIEQFARNANSFMRDILPGALDHLEGTGAIPGGTHAKYTQSLFDNTTKHHSARTLTDHGNKLLLESGIGKYIDDNKNKLIKIMESKKFETALDAEQGSFYIMRDEIEGGLGIGLKNYMYSNPETTKDELILVGSIHLKEIFLDKHSELIPQGDKKS